jgi:hypothetical protein
MTINNKFENYEDIISYKYNLNEKIKEKIEKMINVFVKNINSLEKANKINNKLIEIRFSKNFYNYDDKTKFFIEILIEKLKIKIEKLRKKEEEQKLEAVREIAEAKKISSKDKKT